MTPQIQLQKDFLDELSDPMAFSDDDIADMYTDFLEEHPNIKVNGVLVSSGSLGHGLSYAAGLSLGDKINKKF